MKVRVSKKRWRFALFNLVLLVLAISLFAAFRWITGWLPSLQAAQRWQGSSDMAFTQISCFFPVDEPKAPEEVFGWRSNLDRKLTENSLVPPENGSLYSDAWSAQAKLTVSGDNGSATVKTIGVGGNFFLFHPLRLRSGSYMSGDDLMQDRVLLDETLAWSLFGSSDVAGMTVYVNELPFYVAGVIQREDDFASSQAYRDGSGMFMSYDAFYALTEQKITCYEIVLPNMISGFGMGIVKESVELGNGVAVENSLRYSMKNLIGVAGDFGLRSMGDNGIVYPYWENAVRLTEDYLSLLMVLIAVFAVVPLISFLVGAIRAITKTGKYIGKKVPETAERMVEKKREERYYKNLDLIRSGKGDGHG